MSNTILEEERPDNHNSDNCISFDNFKKLIGKFKNQLNQIKIVKGTTSIKNTSLEEH